MVETLSECADAFGISLTATGLTLIGETDVLASE